MQRGMAFIASMNQSAHCSLANTHRGNGLWRSRVTPSYTRTCILTHNLTAHLHFNTQPHGSTHTHLHFNTQPHGSTHTHSCIHACVFLSTPAHKLTHTNSHEHTFIHIPADKPAHMHSHKNTTHMHAQSTCTYTRAFKHTYIYQNLKPVQTERGCLWQSPARIRTVPQPD